jgi:predicted enzyme related to lactoylglutathione lyase
VEFEVGGVVLAITTMMESAQPGLKGGAVAVEVTEFDAMVAHLKGRGVKFSLEPFDTGGCKMAGFEDPEGNPLILHKKH